MNSRKYKFFVYYFPVIIWIIVIFAASSVPQFTYIKQPWMGFDKFVHFVEYGILGFLLTRALSYWNNGGVTRLMVILSIFIGTVFAGFDELHQKYIPGRIESLNDFIADIFGIVLAQAFYFKGFFKKKIKDK
ncbi:VanZ family protein [candidate division KSB1 bacterium]